MVNWLDLPWCQVLFSEGTVLDVARQLEREGRAANSQLPEETRLDLGSGQTIPFVSHLTVTGFLQVVQATPGCAIRRQALMPPGWRANRLPSRLLRPLTRIHMTREIFTAKAVFVLERLP